MKGIAVKRTLDGLKITYDRFSLSNLFLIPLIFFGYLFTFYVYFLVGFHWMNLYFILLYLIFIYIICLRCFNRTEIILNANCIRIRHTPFPILFNKHILYKREIKQIFVRYIPKRGYNLGIISPINAEYIIIPDISSFEQSCYIEVKIKVYLGLEAI